LRQRILELEKNGPTNPRPTAPVAVALAVKPTPSRGSIDPPEGIGSGPSEAEIAARGGYRVSR
jgi:hypothetical protein